MQARIALFMRLFGLSAIRFRMVERSGFQTFAARLLPGAPCGFGASMEENGPALEEAAMNRVCVDLPDREGDGRGRRGARSDFRVDQVSAVHDPSAGRAVAGGGI